MLYLRREGHRSHLGMNVNEGESLGGAGQEPANTSREGEHLRSKSPLETRHPNYSRYGRQIRGSYLHVYTSLDLEKNSVNIGDTPENCSRRGTELKILGRGKSDCLCKRITTPPNFPAPLFFLKLIVVTSSSEERDGIAGVQIKTENGSHSRHGRP